MRAVAHGWKPKGFKGPSVAVAKDFMAADQKKRPAVKNNRRGK